MHCMLLNVHRRNWQLIFSSVQQPLPSNLSLLCSIVKQHSEIRQLHPRLIKHSTLVGGCVCVPVALESYFALLYSMSIFVRGKHAHIII